MLPTAANPLATDLAQAAGAAVDAAFTEKSVIL